MFIERQIFQYEDYYIVVEEDIVNSEILACYLTKKNMPLMHMYGLQKTDVKEINLWDFILNTIDEYIDMYVFEYETNDD